MYQTTLEVGLGNIPCELLSDLETAWCSC